MQPKVFLLLTGDELLSGDIVDSNSAMLADQLATLGLRPGKKVTVGDALEDLVSEMDALSAAADVLIVNGGLGPTEDDKTAQALAEVLGVELEENPVALAQIEQWCTQRNYPMNPANQKQALLPKGVNIIENTRGSAPGFYCEHNQCLMFFTPGVPHELKAMTELAILPAIQQQFTTIEPHSTKRLQVFGMGESSLQLKLRKHITDWPEDVELGFRAASAQVEVKLTARTQAAENKLDDLAQRVKQVLGAHVIGDGSVQLAQLLVEQLASRQQTITTAESCTGGLIASRITAIAGSSAVFGAGFVTYSNDMKQQMIGVQGSTLDKHGAVSEAVVVEMARGALTNSNSDWAVAVSGIAGPGGGSDDKPVGTVWLAWGRADTSANTSKLKTVKLFLPFERKRFQHFVAHAALDLIRREVLGIDEKPNYFP
ncbi:CinA family nicotinamide mononucleotide deamidase-related protein [Bacterioplanoides sp.]|uniref:CinA family nicotinamide mononucleotide deamidase-related protein n=1 Tax=Bacterioplanoides sp. TaxID=2066072 RepID=UPI003AFF8C27